VVMELLILVVVAVVALTPLMEQVVMVALEL
jgi:hypothetical protein